MADEVLTIAESSRITYVASFLGVARDELLRTVCRIKSFLSSRPSLVASAQAQLAGNWDQEGKAARALFLAVSAAMGGAAIYFSSGLGGALALALAEIGIVVAAEALSVVVLVVGVILLFASLPRLLEALTSLANADFTLP